MDICSASINPLTKQNIYWIFFELFGLTDRFVMKERRTHDEEQYQNMFIRMDITH